MRPANPLLGETAPTEQENTIMDIIWMLGALALWAVLQFWLLPRLGVPT